MTAGRVLVAALALALAPGCESERDPFREREFISTSVTEGGVERLLVGGSRIYLGFLRGELRAAAGCNTLSGPYGVDDGTLTAEGPWLKTELGCPPESLAQDEWLFAILGDRPSLELEGADELVLTHGETTISFLDVEVAFPDLTLIGPVWTLETFIDGTGAHGTGPAILSFSPSGTVQIDTTCSEGSAQFTAVGTTITFEGLSLTRSPTCDELDQRTQEEVLSVLQAETVTYAIDGAELWLMAGDRGLVFFGR